MNSALRGLSAGERSGQRRVRLAKIFDDDPHQCVEQQEKPGQHAARLPRADTQKPETTEKKCALQQRFVKLRRMPRCQCLVEDGLQARISPGLFDHCLEIGNLRAHGVSGGESPRPDFGQVERFFGELHRPRHRRGPTVKFTIDEVRAATEKQTNRRDHSDIIRQAQPRNVVPPPVKKHGESEPDHSAVTRHSRRPRCERRKADRPAIVPGR